MTKVQLFIDLKNAEIFQKFRNFKICRNSKNITSLKKKDELHLGFRSPIISRQMANCWLMFIPKRILFYLFKNFQYNCIYIIKEILPATK